MWLLKTEPRTYSFEDLERDGKATWDGVANPVAQKNLGEMRVGDRVIVYHTGTVRAAVGEARVTRAAYPDPKDPQGGLVVVDLAPVGRLPRPVALPEIKADPRFAESPLLRIGRLSVVPLTREQWDVFTTGAPAAAAAGKKGKARA